MATIKLKAPSGGSVSLVSQDSALDTTVTVPSGNSSLLTAAYIAALPTSASGLLTGALWVDTGAGNVLKRVA